MRDYAEQLKRLRNQAKLERYYNGSGEICDDAADAIEELIARVPKWISVEEKPIPYEWVWGVYRQTVCGKVMQHHKTVKMYGDNIVDQEGNIYNGFITHWMPRFPLPEPPKEETE